MESDMTAMLETIAIELACEKLVVEFAERVDALDFAGLGELFAVDAGFARPTDPNNLIRGVDSIVESYRARPRTRITQHLCCNIRIQAQSADRASGSCRVLLYTADVDTPEELGKGRKATASQLIGAFDDRFVLTTQGWRFAERRGRLLMHT
jgi:hypothetical protein